MLITNIRNFWIIFIIILLPTSLNAQALDANDIDSITHAYEHAQTDSARITAAIHLGTIYSSQDPAKSLAYFDKAHSHILENLKNPGGKYYLRHSLYSYNRELAITYENIGDYNQSLDLFLEAKKYSTYPESGNLLVDIAVVLQSQDNVQEALEYYRKAIKVYRDIENPDGIGLVYGNMAYCFYENNDSFAYYTYKTQEYLENSRNSGNIAWMYNVLASNAQKNNDLDSAIYFLSESLKLRRQQGHIQAEINVLNRMAGIYNDLGQEEKALEILNSINKDQIKPYPNLLSVSHAAMGYSYEHLGQYKLALENYRLAQIYKDNHKNEENKSAILKKVLMHEHNLIRQKDSIILSNITRLHQMEVDKNQAIYSRERSHKWIFFTAFMAFMVVSVLSVIGYKREKKAARTISLQNAEAQQQRDRLTQKNRAITDSIAYARRIQATILPEPADLQSAFRDHFVIYLPKDIVSGDFYWLQKRNEKTFFAVADCTGHGVPGALLSIFCHSALNEALHAGYEDPAEILNIVRNRIIDRFYVETRVTNILDGMDISLCVREGNSLKFAGAHHFFFLLRDSKIIKIKGNRFPVGHYPKIMPFKTHAIEVQKGDRAYFFSDGFMDQFGGEKGKKYNVTRFSNLILQIHNAPLDTQSRKIVSEFHKWKGDYEQVDDICILGIEL